ncbi:MAG: AAA family ATPase [Agriterribacter sp.]
MIKAFVFGKFLPFHKGHEAMIRFALTHCDFLTVLVCRSNKEIIDGSIRKSWIDKTFADQQNVEVRVYDYHEEALSNSSVSSTEVSAAWAMVFKALLPGYTLLITSEPYGVYVADFMGIQHIFFDQPRILYPVSASAIRNDPAACWNFLPDAVKSHFVKKVVILGTESTGKTTLAQQLADHFKATLVSEAGRDIVDDSKNFAFEDLYTIAVEHARRISEAIAGKSQLVIIDTDIHITKSYAHFVFNKPLTVNKAINEANKADLYLYLNNDVPYIQDGTRLNEKERNDLDISHRRVLDNHGINIIEIKGNWAERFETAIKHVQGLMGNAGV